MYPRNAASPERIAIGPVVQISDGAVQTSGVAVKVVPFGAAEATGTGTVAYSVDGVVLYTPTQGETNYTSFVLVASKAGCIPASTTVVTTAASVAGNATLAASQPNYAPLVSLGTNAPAGWLNAAAFAAEALNGKGDWATVGAAMTLTSGERSAVAAACDLALINAADGANLIGALADAIAADWVAGDASPLAIVSAIKADASLATMISRIDVATSTRLASSGYTAPDNAGIAAIKVVTDRLNTGLVADAGVWQFTANMLELGPSGGSSGGTGDASQETVEEVLDVANSIANALAGMSPVEPTGDSVLAKLARIEAGNTDHPLASND